MPGISRRHFVQMTAAGAVSALAARPGYAQEGLAATRPPNLVVIMADDIGAKELGSYGHPDHQTPRLDALARTGVQFQTAYAAPICHPTRVMLMTGQYGCHNKVYHFSGRPGGPEPDSPEEDMTNHLTFAQVLKNQGYATVHAGKWQLSGEAPTQIRECGFDEYCMWAYKHNLPEGVAHKGGWEGKEKTARYWHPSIVKNGEYMPTEERDYGPDIFTDFLIDFIGRHKDAPFFAYYPMCLTHAPHERTPDTIDLDDRKYDRKELRYRYAVEYMDKLVGRIVDALDALGLRENTVVIYTGDNGTGGDGKGDATELGARVPLIIDGPCIVKTRGKTGCLSDLSDIFPTLMDFAGAPLPDDRPIDGVSLKPFLTGAAEVTRPWIHSFLADRRILRTERFLLEDNSPAQYGHLYDCGESRDGTGYKEVTDSEAPEVVAIKQEFDRLLEKLPAPIIGDFGKS